MERIKRKVTEYKVNCDNKGISRKQEKTLKIRANH